MSLVMFHFRFGDRQDLAGVVHKVPESWSTLLGNATHEDVVGLTADRAVSVEELETIRRAGKLNEGIAELEFKSLLESSRKLKDCLQGWQLLADHPLSVVFCDESNDSRKAYESGVEHNNGTEEVLEKLRNHLEEMFVIDEVGMREHLAPSSCARSVKADGKRKTHQGQEVDPKGVAREILWASERLHGKMQPSEVLPGYWIARHDKSYLPTSCRMHQSSPPRDLRKALACQANPGSND